jgi:aminopeptidase N
VEDGVIHVRKRRHDIRFKGVKERPVLSLNRGFSAPVTLAMEQSAADLLFLARHDGDLVGRWQALNTLFTEALISSYRATRSQKKARADDGLMRAAGEIAADETLEPAYRALALTLPAEADIAREIGFDIDPDAILAAREGLARAMAIRNGGIFAGLYEQLTTGEPFRPDAQGAGRRALRNVLLDYLAAGEATPERAARQFRQATNMTDRSAAMTVLAHRFPGHEAARDALAAFEAAHGDDPLVLDKWFQTQATVPGAAAVGLVEALTRHPGFSLSNPNRVRALIGTFSTMNQTGFHRADGAGYRLFVDNVLAIEKRNPQLAARLATALRSWRSLEPARQQAAREALTALAAPKDLSSDLRDIVERTLA